MLGVKTGVVEWVHPQQETFVVKGDEIVSLPYRYVPPTRHRGTLTTPSVDGAPVLTVFSVQGVPEGVSEAEMWCILEFVLARYLERQRFQLEHWLGQGKILDRVPLPRKIHVIKNGRELTVVHMDTFGIG